MLECGKIIHSVAKKDEWKLKWIWGTQAYFCLRYWKYELYSCLLPDPVYVLSHRFVYSFKTIFVLFDSNERSMHFTVFYFFHIVGCFCFFSRFIHGVSLIHKTDCTFERKYPSFPATDLFNARYASPFGVMC